jgi:hypothetical protein
VSDEPSDPTAQPLGAVHEDAAVSRWTWVGLVLGGPLVIAMLLLQPWLVASVSPIFVTAWRRVRRRPRPLCAPASGYERVDQFVRARDGLRFRWRGATVFLAASDVERAHVQTAVLVLETRRDVWHFAFHDRTAANRLLVDIGLDPARHPFRTHVAAHERFSLRKACFDVPALALCGLAGAFLAPQFGFRSWGAVGPWVYAAAWFLTYLIARLTLSARVTVGGDGIHLREPLEPDRFIPYGAIDRADWDERPNTLTLTLRNGERRVISGERDQNQVAPLVLRDAIADAKAAQHELVALPERLLPRAGRSAAEWVRDLGKLLGNRAYRDPSLAPSELARIAEAPQADPEVRVAVALALACSPDHRLRQRVRVASGGCADPDLARALAKAAEGELDEVALTASCERVRLVRG